MKTPKMIGTMLLVAAFCLAAGCTAPVVREYARPSKTKDQYTRIKRVAIFPFENYSDTKDADKVIDALLAPALGDAEIFAEIEDTRFVRDVMKKLKITATEVLDKEVLKKLGDEMNVQAIVYGKIVGYGKGKEKESAPQVTMDMALVESSTGNVLVIANVSAYGGLTAGRVFGVTEGKTEVEVARDAVRRLVSSIASEIRSARARERKGLAAEMKKEEELERAKLDKLKGETSKIQADLDKARKEADTIKSSATKEAEAMKMELEMQKTAIDAEKTKTTAAQQEIDKEKMKVEMERKKVEEERRKLEEERKKPAPEPAAKEPAKAEPAKAEPAKPESVKEEPLKEAAPPAPAPAPADPPKESPAAPPAPSSSSVSPAPASPTAEAAAGARRRGQQAAETKVESAPPAPAPAPANGQ